MRRIVWASWRSEAIHISIKEGSVEQHALAKAQGNVLFTSFRATPWKQQCTADSSSVVIPACEAAVAYQVAEGASKLFLFCDGRDKGFRRCFEDFVASVFGVSWQRRAFCDDGQWELEEALFGKKV